MSTAPTTTTERELSLVVAHKERVADGVMKIALRPLDDTPLPSWEPGAHVDLELGPGLVRQYSLCGAPSDETQLEVAVLREPEGRGGSRLVHDELAEGDVIQVRGPRNHFELIDADQYIFVAGGIGITPIIPMIGVVAARGATWRLVYGGRTRGSMAFLEHLQAAHPDRVQICPEDETGLLDIAAIVGDAASTAGTVVYSCGPEPLLAALEQECATQNVPLHLERFSAKEGALDGPWEAFEVELARSGLIVAVPADQTIVEALDEAGIEVLTSCEEGICGTCQTAVLAGEPEHHDSVLTEEQRTRDKLMALCVSRARTARLVLDL